MDTIAVLLVDDNPTFLRIAARFLDGHEGITVVGMATNGREALGQAHALRPQVILLDLAMPDLSGLETIPLLRAALPDTGIIILTMLDTNGYRQAALAAGADDFVPKADIKARLVPTIQRVLSRRHPGRRWNEPATCAGAETPAGQPA